MSVQRGAPWPNYDDRDAHLAARNAADRVGAEHQARRDAIVEARAKIGFVDHLLAAGGIGTARVREHDALVVEYAKAEARIKETIAAAQAEARDEVHRRQDERQAWEHNHWTEARELALVRQAVEAGSEDIVAAVADGRLKEIRGRLLREAEERTRRAELEQPRRPASPTPAPTPAPTWSPEPEPDTGLKLR